MHIPHFHAVKSVHGERPFQRTMTLLSASPRDAISKEMSQKEEEAHLCQDTATRQREIGRWLNTRDSPDSSRKSMTVVETWSNRAHKLLSSGLKYLITKSGWWCRTQIMKPTTVEGWTSTQSSRTTLRLPIKKHLVSLRSLPWHRNKPVLSGVPSSPHHPGCFELEGPLWRVNALLLAICEAVTIGLNLTCTMASSIMTYPKFKEGTKVRPWSTCLPEAGNQSLLSKKWREVTRTGSSVFLCQRSHSRRRKPRRSDEWSKSLHSSMLRWVRSLMSKMKLLTIITVYLRFMNSTTMDFTLRGRLKNNLYSN